MTPPTEHAKTAPQEAGGPAGRPAQEFELRWLRQLWALNAQLKTGRDVAKVTRAALRAGMDLLGAGEGCIAVLAPGKPEVEVTFSVPREAGWDRGLLTSFIRGGEEPVPAELALGRLRRRGRMWGVLAVRAPGGRFAWDRREALSSLAGLATECLERIDQERVRDVRARIDYKILEQLRPKDLFYQILHGLYSLLQYDHSASLMICDPAAGTLEVVAEAITWKKGKSEKVGMKLPLPEPLLGLLRRGRVHGFNRPVGGWEEWTDGGAAGLAELLDIETLGGDAPLDRSVLCAPLATRERVLGLLKVAARHAGSLGPYEADLVGQFLPHASVALQNSQRAESLELNLIQAERKHAMAELARGVAHDVNNALGAVLPLVQQMRAEAAAGPVDPASFHEDLRQVERAIQVSRRIFGGMLSFARGAARDAGGASVRQAVDNTRALLKEGFRRRGVEVVADVEPGLPALPGAQADLEQLFLNLLTNARDAMPRGGRIAVTARRAGDDVYLSVEDTGDGIPPEHLAKVFEPFFSTKPQGNGLGLAICRSIVWQMQGKLELASTPGEGTRVSAVIPVNPAGGP
jgi:signal transduction histidine kinase